MKETKEGKIATEVLDPCLILPVPSVVNSLCFVSPHNQKNDRKRVLSLRSSPPSESDDEESDKCDDFVFRSSALHHQHRQAGAAFCDIPQDAFLVTGQRESGEALLWDLRRQRQVAKLQGFRGGRGLCVRRTQDPSKVLFQTRDTNGTVSLHAVERANSSLCSTSITRHYETFSQTFCEASPCVGDANLIALPTEDEKQVVVMDERVKEPVNKVSIEGQGMTTSLAMLRSNESLFLCCGMESGTAVFVDVSNGTTLREEYSLGKEPVLTLDVTASLVTNASTLDNQSNPSCYSVLVGAGLAGDLQEMAALDPVESGRTVLLKATRKSSKEQLQPFAVQQRARASTCRVSESSGGKPGVAICRFRPDDGRLLAVGGWDHRVRLFDRSKLVPMALLKGNGGSVSALDWAPNAALSGLFASSGDTKVVNIWKVYGIKTQ